MDRRLKEALSLFSLDAALPGVTRGAKHTERGGNLRYLTEALEDQPDEVRRAIVAGLCKR
jgi:hypothetical protein